MGIKRRLLVQRRADRQWKILFLDNGFVDHALSTVQTTLCMIPSAWAEDSCLD